MCSYYKGQDIANKKKRSSMLKSAHIICSIVLALSYYKYFLFHTHFPLRNFQNIVTRRKII